MAHIIQLSEEEIAKIAAGQVVERPAHIVKELLENSIDAHATIIDVYCEEAGQKLIRVIDNGCGMSKQDALLAFKRHATSKITALSDLNTIQSFGFRGEALPSIAAVSEVSIRTKSAHDSLGTHIKKDGFIETVHEISCNQGTDISVRDLFYTIPARKKFLKKPHTEWRHITHIFQALSLSYPHITMNLYHNNELIYQCTQTDTLAERVQKLWNTYNTTQFIAIETEKDGCTLEGIVSNYQQSIYHRNSMFCFVNKRWAKNYQLINAILTGYSNILPSNKYPIAILYLTINQAFIDINVHPRKEEIAFMQPRLITRFISETINTHLEKEVSKNLQKTTAFFSQNNPVYPMYSPPSSIEPLAFKKEHTHHPTITQDSLHTTAVTHYEFSGNEKKSMQQRIIPSAFSSGSLIGILHNSYILLHHENGLFMIDQHAAHERILYEKFKKYFGNVPTIALLFPYTLTLTQEEYTILQQHAEVLHDHGIIAEFQDNNRIYITAIPIHIKHIVCKDILSQIATWLLEHTYNYKELTHTTIHEKIHAQLACKAAVKAGDILSTEQVTALIENLSKTENKISCPHGRPTSWLLSTSTIEINFKRRS